MTDHTRFLLLLALALAALFFVSGVDAGRELDAFNEAFYFRGAPGYYNAYPNGTVTLKKGRRFAATWRSRERYLYGYFTIWMKAPGGYSAGIITTFFMTSGGGGQDEIDMEFLGHVDSKKIILHTNVFGKGIGNRPEGFSLWFDASKAFHKYTIWWNKKFIVWLVDDIPIRLYRKKDPATRQDNPFPTRGMYIHGSIWNGSVWATQNGLIKPDFSHAPWVIAYRRFRVARSCRLRKGTSPECSNFNQTYSWDKPFRRSQLKKMVSVRRRYLRYSFTL